MTKNKQNSSTMTRGVILAGGDGPSEAREL